MTTITLRRRLPLVPVALAMAFWGLAAFLPVAAASAAAPIGKTYFASFVGMEQPHGLSAGCVSFTRDEICIFVSLPPNTLDTCGSWAGRKTRLRNEDGFRFGLEFLQFLGGYQIDGRCRIDRRSAKSSIGCVGQLTSPEGSFNVSFAGRQVNDELCRQLVDAVDASRGAQSH